MFQRMYPTFLSFSIATIAICFCAAPAFAAEVTIDPGLYKGDFHAGFGFVHGIAQTNDYAEGTRHYIQLGGTAANLIYFEITEDGEVVSDSTRITIDDHTVRLKTVPVIIDPERYVGNYLASGGYTQGVQTIQLVPGGTGNDDRGSQYVIGNGSWPWQTAYSLDSQGNVLVSSTRMYGSANRLTFITVPVEVDAGDYIGDYRLGGIYYRKGGKRTVFLPAAGEGEGDYGNTWVIATGTSPWSTKFEIYPSGDVWGDSSRIEFSGNQIHFKTVPIQVDPGAYEGRYALGSPYVSGPQTIHLIPGGTGSADAGSRWAIGNGAWPFAIYLDVDPQGNVTSTSSRIDVVGNQISFHTVPLVVDPGSYEGPYIIDGRWLRGIQTVNLIPAGSGSMDYGARWNVAVSGVGSTPFDVDSPCAVIPGEEISVAGAATQIDFNVMCLSTPSDTDEDGVVDTSDNCIEIPNPTQLDQDEDGIGNACDPDLDGDGVANTIDNCPDLANPSQEDLDNDQAGDACDNDQDGDLVDEQADNCPLVANTDQADSDLDGQGDACDSDDDNDTIDDVNDNCITTFNPDQLDSDHDLAGDACDGDVDGDSVGNPIDVCAQTPAGLPITEEGCSAAQWIDRTCVASSFANHGRYVSCVAQTATDLVRRGLMTEQEKAKYVTQAARKK